MAHDQYNVKLLESAIDALRDRPVPPAPDAAIQQQLVAKITAASSQTSTSELRPRVRRINMRRFIGIAATILIAAVVSAGVVLNGGSSSSAFAQMIERVTDARTATFIVRVLRNGQQIAMGKTLLLGPNGVREESGEGEHSNVLIFDTREQHKSLELSPGTKKAVLRTMAGAPATPPKNLIDQVRALRDATAELVGEEIVDDTTTLKYRCNDSAGHYVFWIDKETDLPVRVRVSASGNEQDEAASIEYSNFQWNVPLDESLFSLQPPEGYELVEEQHEAAGLDPTDFIATLRAHVRLNNDQFPDEYNALSPATMTKLLDGPNLPEQERMANYRRKLAQAMGHANVDATSDEEWARIGPMIGQTMARGAVFLHALGQTHDFYYVGKGAKLGEADRIVAWWTVKSDEGGPKEATVLYGDLRVESQQVDGLPVP